MTRKRGNDAKSSSRRARLNERLQRGAQEGACPADRAASLSSRLWTDLLMKVALDRGDGILGTTGKEDKALRSFYHRAVMGNVAREHVTEEAARGYLLDKFAARCDKMCGALLSLAERTDWLLPTSQGSQQQRVLRVASIGGGPGNDAWGSFLFAALTRTWQKVDAHVFDFSPVWRPYCEAVGSASVLEQAKQRLISDGAGSVDMTLHFEEADLRAPTNAAVNRRLLDSLDGFGLVLLSHVVRESQACRHSLLPELLRRSRAGTVFVFLDMRWADLDVVQDMVQAMQSQHQNAPDEVETSGSRPQTGAGRPVPAGESEPPLSNTIAGTSASAAQAVEAAASETEMAPDTRRRELLPEFQSVRVGESQHYAFFGLAFRKL